MTKIAICDDDPLCLAWVQNLILFQGDCTLPELRTFSGSNALISAITEDGYLPDIAVLDIVMPGDSGIELAKQLNMSMPTILTNVNELMENELIVEVGQY